MRVSQMLTTMIFHSDVLSGKGIMLLYNGEYTMVSNIVISEGILPHYDAYFF